MPVTARLSEKFYKTFGEDVTNELVNWFNTVDATYRTDLRELNELNFTRFDAKMGERLAAFDTKLAQRFAEYDVKLEHRLSESDAKLERSLADLRAELRIEIAAVESRLIKWMFAFWAPTAIGVVALLLRK